MSDNTDRIMKDFEKTVKELPPQAFLILIEIWRKRAASGEHCEKVIWEQAIRELRAACNAERGDAIKTLEILVTQ
jgi:hypothetical protein